MAFETQVQSFVRSVDTGKWREILLFLLLGAACAGVWVIFIFGQFRGISSEKAMDQAQIARELARGNGFSTKFVRPAAIAQFEQNKHVFPSTNTPDTYNAPLYPWFNSWLLRCTKSSWAMTQKDVVYTSDRVIAAIALMLFFLSVVVNYFTAKRLFDRRLALLGMGLVLLADAFWKFSVSGLPQAMMLLIFSGCTHALVRALEARREGRIAWFWLAATGAMFGLLALTHALTIWIFLGALLFLALAFWPPTKYWWMRGLKNPALLVLVVFLLFYVPWLVRTYHACGSPFGVAAYSVLFQIRGTESQVMRSLTPSFSGVGLATFRSKIQNQVVGQFGNIYGLLGQSLVAPLFFVALLHLFKNPVTSLFRWCILLMWLFALLGMAVFGFADEGTLQSNDLHLLFIPIFIFYGLAFVLVLWTRVTNERPKLNLRMINVTFLTIIFLISGFPLVNTLLSGSPLRVQWPPYVPPFIAILNKWTSENEYIASDMPWAVAWYADRKSLWLPDSIKDFLALSDYNRLGGPLAGLYLTPETGNKALISDVVKGEYKEWAPFILRNVNMRDFPLHAATALPLDNECIFYSDRPRWSEKTD